MSKTNLLALGLIALAAFSLALTACGGAPAVDAQTAVNDACSRLEAVDSHRLTMRYESVEDGEDFAATIKLRTSGDDYHVTYTSDDGVTDEVMQVGGNFYLRLNQGTWEVTERTVTLSLPYRPEAACPDLPSALKRVGEETIGSSHTTRYSGSSAYSSPGASGATDQQVNETWDYWVDATGQLVRLRQTWVSPAGGGLPAQNIVATSDISGVGEPNVITAPVIP